MRNPFRVQFMRDLALTGGTQVIQGATAMIAGLLVARSLGPSANGTLSVLMTVAGIAVSLGLLGLQFSSVYFLGQRPSQRAEIASNAAVVGLAGGVLTGAAVLGLGVALPHQVFGRIPVATVLLFLPFIPCNYWNQIARRVALGVGRVPLYNVPDLVSGLALFAGTAIALVVFGDRLTPLVIVRVVPEALIALALFAYLLRLIGGRLRASRSLLGEQARYGLRNYTSGLMWLLLLQSDLILCNDYLGSRPAGVYSIAVSLGIPVTLLAGVLGTLVFQRVSADHNRPNRIANTNLVMRMLTPIVGVIVIAMAIAARWLIPVVYGPRFGGAVEALVILLPGLWVLSIETVLMGFLAGEGSPPIVFIAPVVGLALNLGINLFVIPRFGINGAAATSSASYAIVLLLVLRYYLRSTESRLREAFVVGGRDFAVFKSYGPPAGDDLPGLPTA